MAGHSLSRNVLLLAGLIATLLAGALGLYAAPQKFPPRYQEALSLYNKGKHEDSLAVIRTVFTPQYRPYEMRMLAAANYARLGKTKNAIDHMTWCIKEHPKRTEPRIMLTGLLRTTGQLKEAARIAAQAITQLGENADLRLELARLEYLSARYPAARSQIARIPRGNVNYIEAVMLDGLIFLKEQRPDEAAFRFRQALNQRPRVRQVRADLENNLGVALELKGDLETQAGRKKYALLRYGQAEKAYARAIRVMPRHPNAASNLARLRKKL